MKKYFSLLFLFSLWRFDTLPASDIEDNFSYFSEQFSDLRILRYRADGFADLTLEQKKLIYFLAQAGMSGRDIFYDQNYKHNLTIRRTLEEIYKNYRGDRTTDEFKKFEIYLKRIWFSNGIHHHYSGDKIMPEFPTDYFIGILLNSPSDNYPILDGEMVYEFIPRIIPIMFDPNMDPKKVNKDSSLDVVKNSAANFYENLSFEEVNEFYQSLADGDDETPVSYGLNSKLVKNSNGKIFEIKYKQDGMYHEAITKIIYWLEKALPLAASDLQRASIETLIKYYRTGDLELFDEFNVLWVLDTTPTIDFINGFIEDYNDPLGRKGSYESLVFVEDLETSAKYGVLGDEAAWFEANSPIMEEHKKSDVRGISYKIINVISETGDSSPSTPIGINLPNSDWIRAEYGSKSISLGNIENAYAQASKNSGMLEEFYLPEAQGLIKEYGELSRKLMTGLHEVIGHASGKLNEGVGSPSETLKGYASALEEARADLVALYFIGSERLLELDLIPSSDIKKASYISYLTNGLLTQMARIKPGKYLEEAHMRNRQLIASWVWERAFAEGAVKFIEQDSEPGINTFIEIKDYERLNELFGDLLREVQRIKSEGDYEAGKNLVESYGVKLDPDLHAQVLRRYESLNIAPFSGFINPQLKAIKDEDGNILDIDISYPEDFSEQMLYYSEKYSFLPNYN